MTLDELKQYAAERHIPIMSDSTRQLLYETVAAVRPQRILEIGTAIGYSGVVMLSASPQARLNTIEISEEYASIARSTFEQYNVSARVNLFVGDARDIVPQLTGQYDFIFSDGPKGQYEAFFPYLTELLAVGGVLVCDNVLYKGLVENVPSDKRHKHITVARNMRAFLDDLTSDKRYSTVLHREGDGVTVSTKLY